MDQTQPHDPRENDKQPILHKEASLWCLKPQESK